MHRSVGVVGVDTEVVGFGLGEGDEGSVGGGAGGYEGGGGCDGFGDAGGPDGEVAEVRRVECGQVRRPSFQRRPIPRRAERRLSIE